MNLADCIRESNRIEGVVRPVTPEEVAEHRRFVNLPHITVLELERFVTVYSPGGRLRLGTGADVRVGDYVPPKGGPHILARLDALLAAVDANQLTAYETHTWYLALFPFDRGNGASGRALWYWQMRGQPAVAAFGFLHGFYWQTLDAAALKGVQTDEKE